MTDLLIVLAVAAVAILVLIGIRATNRARTEVPANPARREALLRQPLETALVARIADLCTAGLKIQSIKELRDATGLGLKDAKDLVEAIQAGHRPAPLVQGEILAARVHTRDLADRARKLMADGQEVQAIRLVCDETGMGIADAQKFVKAL